MLREDLAAIGVDFAERDGSHPGSFESEGESADAGKEVEDIHSAPCRTEDVSGVQLHPSQYVGQFHGTPWSDGSTAAAS